LERFEDNKDKIEKLKNKRIEVEKPMEDGPGSIQTILRFVNGI
jgi:hypothetical protein